MLATDNWTFQLCSIPRSEHMPAERISNALQLNDDMHLIHTIKGRGTLLVGNQRFETTPDNVLAVPIFTRCYWEKPAGSPWNMINVHIRLYERKGLPLHERPALLPISFRPVGLKAIHAKLNRWNKLWHGADPLARTSVAGGVLSLLGGYLQKHASATLEPGPTDPEMYALRKQLESAPGAYFDANALADEAGLSISQCNRRFRACFGISPKAYWQRHRLALAQSMLNRSPRSIGQIADELGFSDIYYFSRWFKSLAGMPPATFRREQRKI